MVSKFSKDSFLAYLETIDENFSDWPEWRKRPEASIVPIPDKYKNTKGDSVNGLAHPPPKRRVSVRI